MYTNLRQRLTRPRGGDGGQATVWFVGILVLLFAMMFLYCRPNQDARQQLGPHRLGRGPGHL
jgi:hypothetical protein